MQYEFSGVDELGVSVSCDDTRVTIAVNCRADAESIYELGGGYDDYGYEDDEEEMDEDSDSASFESGDQLLNLLAQVRQQLIEGDYRALYAVWGVYGQEDAPPQPPDTPEGQDVVEQFQGLLASA